MAHKTLIGGTAYEISGGKTLVNGTVYSIKNGKTLVDGTAYEVGFVDLISFSWYTGIGTLKLSAEPGMTWEEWVGSGYNPGGFVLKYQSNKKKYYVYNENYGGDVHYDTNGDDRVYETDAIIENYEYY